MPLIHSRNIFANFSMYICEQFETNEFFQEKIVFLLEKIEFKVGLCFHFLLA